MIYRGIFSESESKAYPIRHFHHEAKADNGKMTRYYECFSNDPDQIQPAFGEDEEPNPKKIKSVWEKLKGGKI
jgi:hypothetical protein